MLLYDSPVSGNCYKVRLLFAQLGLAYERRELSVVDRSDRAEVLGELNPALRVPTLVLDDGRALAESNAIIWYFAEGTRYLPDDRFDRAKVLQWLFFEQYDHEPTLAVVRFWVAFAPSPPPAAEIEARRDAGYRALDALERALLEAPLPGRRTATRSPTSPSTRTGCQSWSDEVSGGVKLRLTRAYGTYLVRLRASSAHGVAIVALLWPVSNSSPPEIDFVEDNGASPRALNTATFHYGPGDGATRHYLRVNMSRWHTFGVTWRPGLIVYRVDGRAWASVHSANVPSTPMNLALQAQTWNCGNSWEQCPYSGATPKVNLDIDWVVVYAPTSGP